jgi:hypothetical protein
VTTSSTRATQPTSSTAETGNHTLQAGDGDDSFRVGPTVGPGGRDYTVGGDGTDIADFQPRRRITASGRAE